MGPIKMQPFFRHGKDTPWGGEKLRSYFQKHIPDDRTGESLEISALPGMESRDAQGRSLLDWITSEDQGFLGTEVTPPLPLLLKLIDAREPLSVQVHPDNSYAATHEGGKLGKTEAWVILDADEDAKIVYGIKPGIDKEQLRQAAMQGATMEDCLRYLPVHPGDVIYIPAGMVHAIGAGILLYEIQQSSDVTYRFWDWGRTGMDGQPRTLHLEQALAVTDPSLCLEPVQGERMKVTGGYRTKLVQDENFSLHRLLVQKAMPLEEMPQRFRFLTALCQGYAISEAGAVSFKTGDSQFIPASSPRIKLECEGELLLASPSPRGGV